MIDEHMSEADYHGRPELSSTGARLILQSPAKFRHRMLEARSERRPEFDLGSAVHAKVLGVGWGVEELDFPDFRSKAARDARDAAYEAGLVPMLSKDLGVVHEMAEAVLANSTAKALFELPGAREVSVFGQVDGVDVRARFDALTETTAQGRFGIDLKTTAGLASPDEFARSVVRYGYDVQEAHYRDTFEASESEPLSFVFVVVEKEPPYLTAVHQLDALFRDMGKTKARVARATFADCMSKNEWPGYPTDVQLVSPPSWAVIDHEMRYVS